MRIREREKIQPIVKQNFYQGAFREKLLLLAPV